MSPAAKAAIATACPEANNLDAWTITPIAPNRYLVTAPDLDAWLTGRTPDPDLLAQARHDFGKMIATPELLDELKNTEP